MNYKRIGKFLAQILSIEALFMIPALLISLCLGEMNAVIGFLISLVIIAVVAGGLFFFCKDNKRGFYAKDGLVCVGIGWIAMSLLGCLPFFISGEIPNYLDALFEIVSGFTTTGASILPEVESLSKGILYWRSFSHWLGGMGVLVFLLAITPVSEQNKGFTMHILRAESPGPNVGKIVPKMKQTAMILYIIYILLTLLNFVFLLIGRMPVFDAVCTALGTAGTGGFGIKNDSMASYSPYIQNVCTVFMLLFGVNFSCYYLLILKQFKNIVKDEELRLYVGLIVGSIVLIVWNLQGYYETLGETVRHAAFQVATVITTTGFATTDFDLWPSFSKAILFTLMFVGACAGSTGGGIKCCRILILFKSLYRNIRSVINPQKIQVVRINKHMVDEKVITNTNAYLAAYIIIIILSFMVVSLDGYSMMTNFSAVVACFNNIGPGFEAVGPTCNFGDFGMLSKLVFIADMLAGRLEIFPILILASRSTWRR
jgi:trk system potassium uptake protein TrkH